MNNKNKNLNVNKDEIKEVYNKIMSDGQLKKFHNSMTSNYNMSTDLRSKWKYEYFERLAYLHEVGKYVTGIRMEWKLWPKEI